MVDNQHQKISGYRDLSETEILQMNNVKELAATCGVMIESLERTEGLDKRAIALARTNLQQGFMWAVRAIAQPTTFG